MLKTFFKLLWRAIKWAVVALICLELASFIFVHAGHYLAYGRLRDYYYVNYDPYTFFRYKDGLRPTANNSTSEDESLNRLIWLFGGSTMRGHTSNIERTIPSLMAARLNQDQRPLQFTLINHGEPAFNSLQEVKYFISRLIDEKDNPDLVLFYDGVNDSIFLSQYRDPNSHYGMRRMKALIENYQDSFLGLLKPVNAYVRSSFTKELYDKLNQVLFKLDENAPLLTEYIDNMEKRYEFVNETARHRGAKFVLIWQPMAWVQDCKGKGQGDLPTEELLSRLVAASAMKHNYGVIYKAVSERFKDKPYFINLKDELCNADSAVYQPDGIHLNDHGRKIMADKISRIVTENIKPAAQGDGGN